MNDNNVKPPDNIENSIELPIIELDDIHDEIDYYKNSFVCYILEGSPPQHVIEGFLRRIWVKKAIDRNAIIGNGIYMVRLCNLEDQEKILVVDCHFFMASH